MASLHFIAILLGPRTGGSIVIIFQGTGFVQGILYAPGALVEYSEEQGVYSKAKEIEKS